MAPLNLVPSCDRCGQGVDLEDLVDDGLGFVGPCCVVAGVPS